MDTKYKINVLRLLILFSIGLCETNVENFGPYSWEWLKYETCKGPKKGECGAVRIENIQNMSDVIYVLDITQDCPVTKAKVVISTLQNNSSTVNKLWNYRLDKPCQHFVLGPLLVNSFNLNNRCKINKGHYDVHINMNELATKFLGSSFFYGTFSFKVMAFNDKNNFFCTLNAMTIKKRI